MRRRHLLPSTFALALLLGAASAAAADEKTTAVVLDRTGAVAHGDPRGEGRFALAFALALTAKPGARVVVFAPALDPPVEGDALSLDSLVSVLKTVVTGPSLGGANLVPLFRDAAARGAVVVAYTSGELDVVDARGRVPQDILAKARETDARPDRKGVNEAARSLLAELAKPLEGKLVALRTPLPAPAKSVPFLEVLGARIVELEQPLEATRRLAKEIAGVDLPAVATLALDEGRATVAAERGSRVVLLGDKGLRIATKHGFALDGEGRAWVVDADAPFEVEGAAGTKVSTIAAPRTSLEFAAAAYRLASGGIHVTVTPRDRTLSLAARAEGQDLERSPDGSLRGRLPRNDASAIKLAVGAPGALPEPGELAVTRAVIALEAAEAPLAGARTRLVAHAASLPTELLPRTIGIALVTSGAGASGKASVELTRSGDSFVGEVVLTEGTWTLDTVRAGELAVELRAPLATRPAGVLTATLVEAGKIVEGSSVLLLDLAVDPPLAADATPLVAATRGLARIEGGVKDRARVRVVVANVEPGPNELELTLPLARGAESRAKVSFGLELAPSWKKPAAAGLFLVALAWGLVVHLRRRALARRFGAKQLRGLGSNGKMSYERYPLIEHRDGRWAAIAPPGATAARLELTKDGRVRARALEGSELSAQDGKKKDEILCVHETLFLVKRGLYTRPWVYLEREPTGEELAKRYIQGAPSYDGESSRDSDVFVLLDDQENMVPPSQRLVPVDSARLPQVDEVLQAESDESVVVTNSDEERVLDDESAILDPGSSDSTLDDIESDDSVESSEST